jgi:undecaprenyl-diphosphatase
MTTFQAAIIGIVQGLTEFLPISSTAHLKIVPALLGWEDPGAAFSAVIQIGTLLAVVSYFWRDLIEIGSAMLRDARSGKFATTGNSRLGWMIVVGTIPIVACGLLFKDAIETWLRSLYVMSAALIVVALLLAIAELVLATHRRAGWPGRTIAQMNWRDGLLIGLAQAAALVPGTSRSGATILGGLACGLNRETAARYSFLLSVPAISAAGVYQLVKARHELLATSHDSANLIVALVASGLVGYAAIGWLLSFLRSHSTMIFVLYRLALGGLLIYLLRAGLVAA